MAAFKKKPEEALRGGEELLVQGLMQKKWCCHGQKLSKHAPYNLLKILALLDISTRISTTSPEIPRWHMDI